MCFDCAAMRSESDVLPPIDGIEQLDEPPKGAQPFPINYYRDQREDLISTVTALPFWEMHVIVSRQGWAKRIYRKADAAKQRK